MNYLILILTAFMMISSTQSSKLEDVELNKILQKQKLEWVVINNKFSQLLYEINKVNCHKSCLINIFTNHRNKTHIEIVPKIDIEKELASKIIELMRDLEKNEVRISPTSIVFTGLPLSTSKSFNDFFLLKYSHIYHISKESNVTETRSCKKIIKNGLQITECRQKLNNNWEVGLYQVLQIDKGKLTR